MNFSKLALAASISVFGVVSHAAPNLVVNGTFDDFSVSFSGYSKVLAGATSLTSWAVGGTSVDVVNGGSGAISGNSIDMLGTPGPGSLSQSFATVIGQSYVLSFDLSRNGSDSSDLSVFLNGAEVGNYSGTDTPTLYTLSFTGASNSMLLAFKSADVAANGGAVLDNVSVTAVPEPESYAMLLSGLGLMGFVAHRRKDRNV